MRFSLTTLLPVVVLSAMAPAASADSFVDTTPGLRAFAVPAGVSSLSVGATGGAGGDVTNNSGTTLVAGGRGALVTGAVTVFPGEQLQLTVAGSGGNANASTGTTGGGGAPDGGTGGWSAAGGGGATRVLDCAGVMCPVAVIAAGGGGAGNNGFVVMSPCSVTTLPGGPGGDAGARGTDGSSDTPISGGSGGQPGTSAAGGTGGSGADTGGGGSGPTGGAGGNQTGAFNGHEGGGGGAGGVFGGGGGGSGAFGMDSLSCQAYAGGGGGGGGSSLAPPGGSMNTAAHGAAPGIVLTWTPPGGTGPGSGPGSGGGGVAVAAVSRETLSPRAFPAAPSGPSALAARGRYGTKVGYTLNEAASVRFTVVRPQPGRKAKGGRCVKPTKTNRKGGKCTRLVALRGSFTRAGSAGANSIHFTGRLSGHKLKPGKYRLVATPRVGAKTGRPASASFQIIT